MSSFFALIATASLTAEEGWTNLRHGFNNDPRLLRGERLGGNRNLGSCRSEASARLALEAQVRSEVHVKETYLRNH